MTQAAMYHGGLVFLGNTTNAMDRFCRIVTATLEDYGHQVERQSIQNPTQARIVTSQYMIKLALDDRRYSGQPDEIAVTPGNPTGQPRHRLTILMAPVSEGHEDRDISELMMVVMLYRMVDICSTEQIEWMDPATVLTVDQFLSAFCNVAPHRVRHHPERLDNKGSRIAPTDDTAPHGNGHLHRLSDDGLTDADETLVDLTDQEVLALAFRTNDQQDHKSRNETAQNDIRRLAAWGLTGMVAFLSAPVAASMAAVNLARGEDFRLNTQVLSLTGLLVVLQSSGTLANVMSYLPV